MLAHEDDREVARRIAVRIEDERAAQQPLRDDGGRFTVGIVLERDLDEHARELAPRPRGLPDGPRERGFLPVAAEAIGERIPREDECAGAGRGVRARLDRIVDVLEPRPRELG